MVAGVERRKTSSKSFRVEIEAPRKIADFLRGPVLSDGNDYKQDIENMVSALSLKMESEERARELLCKYFKEAEHDQSLKYLFDDRVFSAITKVLGGAYLKTTYTYKELGIDEALFEKLKKIDAKKFMDKKLVIKRIEEVAEKLNDQLLFISALNHQSVITYDDYATAKLRIRTVKVFLSKYGLNEVCDFLKMVDEMLGSKLGSREDRVDEKNRRILHRISTIFHKYVLEDMAIVLGEPWSRIMELLMADENNLIKLEGLDIKIVQKEIVERTKSKNP